MMQSVFCKNSESRAANANLFANLSEAHPIFCKDSERMAAYKFAYANFLQQRKNPTNYASKRVNKSN